MGTDRRATAAMGTTVALWASAFVAIRVALRAPGGIALRAPGGIALRAPGGTALRAPGGTALRAPGGFGVAGLSLGRLVVASVALAVIAPLVRVRIPARADLLRIAGCGLTGMTAYQLLLNAGERTVPAGTASLLIGTGPVFAALLAFVLLREPLAVRAWIGIGLGFGGAAIMALAQGGSLAPSPDALLILAAAVAQALFFVLQKPLLAHYRGFEVTCYAMWSGTLLALPLAPWLVADLPRAGTGPLLAVLFLGVAPSAVGFLTWAYAQARVPVARAANTLYLVPFLAIGIGWASLRETVHAGALAGGLIALAGVAVSNSGRRRPTGGSEPGKVLLPRKALRPGKAPPPGKALRHCSGRRSNVAVTEDLPKINLPAEPGRDRTVAGSD